jgi:hypothetical protein
VSRGAPGGTPASQGCPRWSPVWYIRGCTRGTPGNAPGMPQCTPGVPPPSRPNECHICPPPRIAYSRIFIKPTAHSARSAGGRTQRRRAVGGYAHPPPAPGAAAAYTCAAVVPGGKGGSAHIPPTSFNRTSLHVGFNKYGRARKCVFPEFRTCTTPSGNLCQQDECRIFEDA